MKLYYPQWIINLSISILFHLIKSCWWTRILCKNPLTPQFFLHASWSDFSRGSRNDRGSKELEDEKKDLIFIKNFYWFLRKLQNNKKICLACNLISCKIYWIFKGGFSLPKHKILDVKFFSRRANKNFTFLPSNVIDLLCLYINCYQYEKLDWYGIEGRPFFLPLYTAVL